MDYFYEKNTPFPQYSSYVNICVNYTQFRPGDIVTNKDTIDKNSGADGVSINDTDDLIFESTGLIISLTNMQVIARPVGDIKQWEFIAIRNSNLSIDGPHWDISIIINGKQQFKPKPINELIVFLLQ